MSGVLTAQDVEKDTTGYAPFIEKLRNYLPNNTILPLFSKLPANGSVYGFDVGDVTGNGELDLIVSLRKPRTPSKRVFVYFFGNQAEKLELLKVLYRDYNQDPLEVAFYIEDGVCFLTDKIKEKHWQIDGYTATNFVFKSIYHWENHVLRGGKIGVQIERDFSDMRTTETYYKTATMKPEYRSTFYTVPSYPLGKHVAKDIVSLVNDTSYRAVLEGTSNWFGKEDCAIAVTGRYDSTRILIYSIITDDVIVGADSTTKGDELELWLSTNGPQRYQYRNGSYMLAGTVDENTLAVTIAADESGVYNRLNIRYCGFAKKRKIVSGITASSALMRNGSTRVVCSIPRKLFGNKELQADIGFTAAFTDIDNPDKPEWKTVIATAENFRAGVPYTFGRMMFLGRDKKPFERDDFRMRPLLRELTNVGIISR